MQPYRVVYLRGTCTYLTINIKYSINDKSIKTTY